MKRRGKKLGQQHFGNTLFLDLGSGTKPGRALQIARRRDARGKEGTIVAVDIEPPEPYDKPKNLKRVQADAVKYLKGLRESSVKVINFDLTLSTGKMGDFFRATGVDKISKAEYIQLSAELAREMNRVLVPQGRIMIFSGRIFRDDLVSRLRSFGFEVTVFPFSRIYHKIQSKPRWFSPMVASMGLETFINRMDQIVARKPYRKKS